MCMHSRVSSCRLRQYAGFELATTINGELPAPPQLPAAGWLHAPFHTQTKLGLGHLKELPVKTTWPVEQLNWKTAQSSESWLATISHWPLLSNWEWQVSK